MNLTDIYELDGHTVIQNGSTIGIIKDGKYIPGTYLNSTLPKFGIKDGKPKWFNPHTYTIKNKINMRGVSLPETDVIVTSKVRDDGKPTLSIRLKNRRNKMRVDLSGSDAYKLMKECASLLFKHTEREPINDTIIDKLSNDIAVISQLLSSVDYTCTIKDLTNSGMSYRKAKYTIDSLVESGFLVRIGKANRNIIYTSTVSKRDLHDLITGASCWKEVKE